MMATWPELPAGVRQPAHATDLLDAGVPCQVCGEPLGEECTLLVERAGDWLRLRPRHPACGDAELVELDAPAELEPSRGVHRAACIALPDGRAALLVNPDVDAPTWQGDEPALAGLLAEAGWARWPAPPGRVTGWAQAMGEGETVSVEVTTMLGVLRLDPAPPKWVELVRRTDQLPVLALLDRHLDEWTGASGWAAVATLLDEGVLLAGLVDMTDPLPADDAVHG